jgi:predicted ATPase
MGTSKEFGFPLWLSMARFLRGWTLAQEGQPAEGVREMREGIASIMATGAAMGLPYLLCILARACGKCGAISEGLDIVEKALGIAESGAKCRLTELLRTKGELLLLQNPQDDAAEGWLRQAMTLAHDQGLKSHELRAATSLARLHIAKGRAQEARNLLLPVYEWFTEGLETHDLLDAKEILSHPQ